MLKTSKDRQIGVGIDFGNTNLRVGIYQDDRFEYIPDELGNLSIPSYLYIDDNGEIVTGLAAKQQAINNPQNTLCHVKELIGKTAQQLYDLEGIKVESLPTSPEKPLFVFKNSPLKYKIEDIIAIFFAKLKSLAEQFLENQFIHHVAISIPPSFGDLERLVISDAAKIAGFDGNIRLIRDPVAACLAYDPTSINNSITENKFIFDLGGSHLGLSIFSFEDGVYEQLLAAEYDLGGKNFDHILMEYCISDLKNIKNNATVMKRLEDQCEKAKKELTVFIETQIEVENDICKITRQKFEDLSSDLFQQIICHIDKAFQQSGLLPQQLSKFILSGGASKIPKITEIVKNHFKGIKIQNNIIDPEIAGVSGAAIQAAIISGSHNKPIQLACRIDFTLLPMGIEVSGGFMPILIDRGTAFELEKKYLYTTSEENQTTLLVNLFEGYSPIAKENHLLASVILDNISPAPRGVSKIEVAIKIDADDILRLVVTEIDTENSKEFAVPYYDAKWGIEDVEKCRNDADAKVSEYKQVREKMEALSLLESWVYHIRNQLKDQESACQEVIDWIQENPNLNKEDYEKKLEMIQEVFRNLKGDENIVLSKGLPNLA